MPTIPSHELIKAIVEAVRATEVTETEAWHDLDVLSSQTVIDGIEVFDRQIKFKDDGFEGPINVHCTLNYDSGEEGFALSETFPGRFEGRLERDGPVLTRLSVDTSGFYA